MSVSNFLIKFFSEYVGKDKLGNSYYKSKSRRFVIYNGVVEPTKVPPMWHAWLHHLIQNPPSHENLEQYSWQKNHLPNLTGTKEAYNFKKGAISSDYQPWKPS